MGLELPKTMAIKVSMAPPEIRKATAASSLRPIELENGMTVNAPAFIKEGDIVKIVSMRPKSKNKRWRVIEIVRESIKIG